jgi:hypothetical protein
MTSQADGGSVVDGGSLPTQSCPGDPDGLSGGGDIVVSELAFGASGFLEFYNRSAGQLSLQSLTFSGTFSGTSPPAATLGSQQYALEQVHPSADGGEIAVYAGSPLQMTQYFCWGLSPVTALQNQAVQAQLWSSSGQCILAPAPGNSIHLRGAGTSILDYVDAPPSPLGCQP